jgi:hypothetical protein
MKKYTVKELIKRLKRFDNISGINTKISVYFTSVGNDSKRHTIVVDPDSNKFYDTTAMIGFEDCTVSDTGRYELTDKEHLFIIIVDLDKHYDNATYDKWWRK